MCWVLSVVLILQTLGFFCLPHWPEVEFLGILTEKSNQVGWGLEQSVESVSAHGREVGTRWSLWSLLTQTIFIVIYKLWMYYLISHFDLWKQNPSFTSLSWRQPSPPWASPLRSCSWALLSHLGHSCIPSPNPERLLHASQHMDWCSLWIHIHWLYISKHYFGLSLVCIIFGLHIWAWHKTQQRDSCLAKAISAFTADECGAPGNQFYSRLCQWFISGCCLPDSLWASVSCSVKWR